MGVGTFPYKVVYLLHILAIVVGFGSSFVWPALAARARKLESPAERYAITHTVFGLGKPLTTYPIYAAGAFGVLLVLMDSLEDFSLWGFDQLWISLAFLLFFAAVGVATFLHYPNLKKMDELGGRLVAGDVTPNPGGPPQEVLELQDRAKQAGMYGGILHLLFLLLMIDMIWKPGF